MDAVDAAGNRSPLARVFVRTAACSTPPAPTDTTRPSQPAALSASNITQTSLSLTWNPSTDNIGVTGYDVYRNGVKVAYVTSTSSPQTGLVCGTSYSFGVIAHDAAGNSSSPAQLNASTAACSTPPATTDTTRPSQPAALSASNITQTSLSLTWNPSTDNIGVTGYDVYRNGVKVAYVTSTSSPQTGLVCGTSYSFGVIAHDAAGNSSSPAQLNASTAACSTPPPPTDTTPPSQPTNVAISTATQASIALRWNASTDNVGVTGYRTYANGSLGATTSQPGATVSSLTCGTATTLEIEAYDAAGNRSNRASIIGSTAACIDSQAPTAPANVVTTARTATSISLSWSASSDNVGVAGYGLYRGGAEVDSSSTTTGIFAGLTCNTNYTLAVDAYDAAGNRSSQTS